MQILVSDLVELVARVVYVRRVVMVVEMTVTLARLDGSVVSSHSGNFTVLNYDQAGFKRPVRTGNSSVQFLVGFVGCEAAGLRGCLCPPPPSHFLVCCGDGCFDSHLMGEALSVSWREASSLPLLWLF